MAHSASIATLLLNEVISRIDTLIVAELQKVCRIENLPVSGKKAELQARIRNKAREYFDHGAVESLRALDDRLRNPNSSGTPAARQPFIFKPSPFYKFDRRLGHVILPISKDHRNNVQLNFSLTAHDMVVLQQPTARILVYSAVKAAKDTYQLLDVQFPQQMEIRVNDNEVKANTRGMKNKPGTTKPVDITSFTRKRVDSVNKLTITYALTSTLFQVYIWVSNAQSITDLKAEVSKKVIPKHRTLAELRAKADDTDIITTSTNMKLKDPVSFTRIQIPCRGSSCLHLGCFDLETYLKMQEQAPQWECPLCSKKVPFSDLAVDEYVQEILQKTSSSDEQVTIDLDGQWSRMAESNSKSNGTGASAYDDDDDSDDLIEISGPRPSISVKAEAPNTPLSMATSSITGDIPARGQKRPAAEVIDLTLSDDEQPVNKRPNNDARPIAPVRQSSNQTGQAASRNYPYASHSPLSFMLSGNSNIRGTASSPAFGDRSPFNPPTTTFRNAVYTGIPGADISSNQNDVQNKNQNTNSGSSRHSWSANSYTNFLDPRPGSGSGYNGAGV